MTLPKLWFIIWSFWILCNQLWRFGKFFAWERTFSAHLATFLSDKLFGRFFLFTLFLSYHSANHRDVRMIVVSMKSLNGTLLYESPLTKDKAVHSRESNADRLRESRKRWPLDHGCCLILNTKKLLVSSRIPIRYLEVEAQPQGQPQPLGQPRRSVVGK